MIVTAIKCEECDSTCKISADMPYLPEPWITLHQAYQEDKHYCSHECARASLGVPPSQSTPQSKMRRFLLVDGETADEFEGVLFNTGHVSVDFDARHFPMHFKGWDHLKEMNPGSGVTWIDQEVSDAPKG